VKAKTEVLNHVVRQHEITTPWDHQEIARLLHEWFERFNRVFFADQLPLSFLRFEPSRWTTLRHYRRGRNSVGALHEINLNTRYLDRPLCEVLATLLHEMNHQWQDLFGRSSKRGYHNREFTTRCQALGIPCTGGYCSSTVAYTDPFVALLKQHGIEVAMPTAMADQPFEITSPSPKLRGTSTLKKSRCQCTNLRAAVTVVAVCLRCGQPFRRMD
jgi:SprT-like family